MADKITLCNKNFLLPYTLLSLETNTYNDDDPQRSKFLFIASEKFYRRLNEKESI